MIFETIIFVLNFAKIENYEVIVFKFEEKVDKIHRKLKNF